MNNTGEFIRLMKVYQDHWAEYTIKRGCILHFVGNDGIERIAKNPEELVEIMEEIKNGISHR